MADDEAMRQFLEQGSPPTVSGGVEWVQAPDGSWQQLDPRIKAEREEAARRTAWADAESERARVNAERAAAVEVAGRKGQKNLVIAIVVIIAVAVVGSLLGSLGKRTTTAAPPPTTAATSEFLG